jgi:hypothetical protein
MSSSTVHQFGRITDEQKEYFVAFSRASLNAAYSSLSSDIPLMGVITKRPTSASTGRRI